VALARVIRVARDPSKLDVYHRAHALVLGTYALTARLPANERFGLQAQLRRAVVSIPTNIVEGSARRSTADYARFVEIALGSAMEVRYLLRLLTDLGFLSHDDVSKCEICSDQVVRQLLNLHKALVPGPKP
jgi:four helix bundle protein